MTRICTLNGWKLSYFWQRIFTVETFEALLITLSSVWLRNWATLRGRTGRWLSLGNKNGPQRCHLKPGDIAYGLLGLDVGLHGLLDSLAIGSRHITRWPFRNLCSSARVYLRLYFARNIQSGAFKRLSDYVTDVWLLVKPIRNRRVMMEWGFNRLSFGSGGGLSAVMTSF